MPSKVPVRWCAVYTRKSSEEGLDQAFNSLEAQREAGVAYIQSQASEGWRLRKTRYDDGGISGGTLERPALQRLLSDIQAGEVQIIVVYKVDRLTRSLNDFATLIHVFDTHQVSFASVTQPFNSTSSTGRLMLNVLLSFAQFERELTGERIRDKVLASKQKGMWMGGMPPLGYDIQDRKLVINNKEAGIVRHIFQRYVALHTVTTLMGELRDTGYRTKRYQSLGGRASGGRSFSRGHLYRILQNRTYRGEIAHKGHVYAGEHDAIVDEALWTRVHTMLASHRQTFRSETRVASPSLLKGLLYDDAGHRMSPTHGRKGARQYRYYLSQATIQGRPQEAGSVARVSAHTLEKCVIDAVRQIMNQHPRLRRLVNRMQHSDERERHQWLRQVIQRVEVRTGSLQIMINPQAQEERSSSYKDSHPEDAAEQPLVIEVPFHPPPRGNQWPMGESPSAVRDQGRSNRVLVKALVRGFFWRDQLVTGQVGSLKELAAQERVHREYVMRLLRLSFLAPDIIQAILQGTQPVDLTLERLRQTIPLEWPTQRRRFGFSPR